MLEKERELEIIGNLQEMLKKKSEKLLQKKRMKMEKKHDVDC